MAYRGFVLVDIEAVIHYQDGSHVRVATQFWGNTTPKNGQAYF